MNLRKLIFWFIIYSLVGLICFFTGVFMTAITTSVTPKALITILILLTAAFLCFNRCSTIARAIDAIRKVRK